MILRLCRYYLIKNAFRKRSILIVCLCLCTIQHFMSPFMTLCRDTGLPATCLPMFIYIGDNYQANGLLLCIWVWLISDIPYHDSSYCLLQLRCGVLKPAVSISAYLVGMSFIYWVVVYGVITIIMFPNISFETEWGILVSALNRGAGNELVGTGFVFTKKLQSLFTVTEAFALSASLHILVSVFIGMLVFMINTYHKKINGSLAALIIIIFDFCFRGLGMPYIVLWFSPVSWVNLNILDITNTSLMPGLSYSYVMLLLLSIICGIIAINREKRSDN